MSRLGAQRFGVFTKPPRPLGLAQTVSFGEHRAAAVVKRDVSVEREENVFVTAFLAALAEELPLQLSAVSVSEVEEDVPVYLGQGRGPRRAFVHYEQTRRKLLFRQRPLAAAAVATVEAHCLFASGANLLDDRVALFCIHDALVGRLLVFVTSHEQEPRRVVSDVFVLLDAQHHGLEAVLVSALADKGHPLPRLEPMAVRPAAQPLIRVTEG